LSSDEARFEAARVLGSLEVSASELGYRAQALLAESLARMGAGVDAVARIGHPDVTARIGGRALRIQSKATGQRSFALSAEDLEGIRPRASDQEGYIAVLDLGPPAAWICVRHARAQTLVGRTVPLAMLKAMDDAQFSSQCTDVFVDLVLDNRASIEAFTFSLVRRRALDRGGGEG